MKHNLKNAMLKFAWLFIAAMVAVTACKKDDPVDPVIPAEDGVYVTGTASGFTSLVLHGMMDPGREEGEGFSSNLRTGMFEKFMYLATGNFNIVEKAGATENTYGFKAGTFETIDNLGAGGETDGPINVAEFEINGTAFNVTVAGFYHIIMDKTSGKVWYTKINHWGVIGDATDRGWDADFAMTQKSLTAEAAEWEVTELTIRERGGFKFRYNSGWKITTDDFIIFANIGKGEGATDFIMGGDGFPYPTTGEGVYTVKFMWSLADGWSYTTTRTGDADPLPGIEELFIVGTLNGWNPDAALYMEAQDNAVFKGYQYVTDSDMIKLLIEKGSWAGSWGSPSSGTDGTITDDNAGDIALGQLDGFDGDGFYEIKADIFNETITMTKITTIGVIGDATPGGWDASTPLTWDADNKVWSGSITFSASGTFKFRANNGWDINWGGVLNALTVNGDNIATPGAGEFAVTLSLSGVEQFFATMVN